MRTEIRRLRVAFVRHAMSIDNEAWHNRLPWPGIRDAPLCQSGKDSLWHISTTLGAWKPDVVICSPLARCIETAQAICHVTQATLTVNYALSEIYHTDGDLPPSPEQLKSHHADIAVVWSANDNDFIQNRARRFLASLGQIESRRICLVGHRAWLKAISGSDIANGECVVLEVEIYLQSGIPINAELRSVSALVTASQ